jgi:hypothetical protein
MKHILNEMSEEEKNLIRQQHTGGIKVNTERFNKLLESKSGDVKPLINEEPNWLTRSVFEGKTVNFYSDPENKKIIYSQKKIQNVKKNGNTILIGVNLGTTGISNLTWSCASNEFKKSTIDTQNNRVTTVMYNTNLNNELQKQYCTKSTGGVNVPNATFASTTPSDTQDSNTNFA